MGIRERTILRAVRLACLSFHCPLSEGEAALYAASDAEPDQFHDMADLALSVIHAHTDTEALAVERIKAAIEGKTGGARITAAYRANAGVLLPADVERMAAP